MAWLPAAAVLACPAPSVQVPLAADFELAPGKTVTIAGTSQSITLESVLNDSRCPANVTCVWAGSADVRLRLSGTGGDSTIVLSQTAAGSSRRAGRHLIELRQIAPGRETSAAIAPEAYRVTLRVTAP